LLDADNRQGGLDPASSSEFEARDGHRRTGIHISADLVTYQQRRREACRSPGGGQGFTPAHLRPIPGHGSRPPWTSSIHFAAAQKFHEDRRASAKPLAAEFKEFDKEGKIELRAATEFLAAKGSKLGRPLNGSDYANMKELRFGAADGEWRLP
jgi:hypothetical protein